MPRTHESVELVRRTHRFFWPAPTLNLWQVIMLTTAGVEMGVFAAFVQIQNQFKAGIPWLFPFGIVTGALLGVFLIVTQVLIFQNRLVPFFVILNSFILLVLFLTGLIETAIQLFGSGQNVNNACNALASYSGRSINTLVYLEQMGICNSWYAAFAFWIVGVVFLVWIQFIAIIVNRTQSVED